MSEYGEEEELEEETGTNLGVCLICLFFILRRK